MTFEEMMALMTKEPCSFGGAFSYTHHHPVSSTEVKIRMNIASIQAAMSEGIKLPEVGGPERFTLTHGGEAHARPSNARRARPPRREACRRPVGARAGSFRTGPPPGPG